MKDKLIKGIYKITLPQGGVYIGQTVNMKKRWRQHKQPSHKDRHTITREMAKNEGVGCVCDVLHELPYDVSKEIMDTYEQLYMDSYRDAGVVLLNAREAGHKGKQHEATKEKISIAHKGMVASDETKRKISAGLKGHKSYVHTEEQKRIQGERMKGNQYAKGNIPTELQRERSREAHLGNKYNLGKKRTEEQRARNSASKMGIGCIKVLCCDNGVVYPSIGAAAKELNISHQNIGLVAKGKRKTVGGYKFIYYKN